MPYHGWQEHTNWHNEWHSKWWTNDAKKTLVILTKQTWENHGIEKFCLLTASYVLQNTLPLEGTTPPRSCMPVQTGKQGIRSIVKVNIRWIPIMEREARGHDVSKWGSFFPWFERIRYKEWSIGRIATRVTNNIKMSQTRVSYSKDLRIDLD